MGHQRKTKRAVSASALSQMGVCERLVVFENREGKRSTPAQRAALQRGLRAHRQFASEGVPDPARVGRCFIATHVFGEGQETQFLRRFRDRLLRLTRAGRCLIRGDYRVAPRLCQVMERQPWRLSLVRRLLPPLVRLLVRCLGMPGAEHRG